MELLEQCRIWHENDEHQKIIDALEAIPEGERTPEQDMELARACNNQGHPGTPEGRALPNSSDFLIFSPLICFGRKSATAAALIIISCSCARSVTAVNISFADFTCIVSTNRGGSSAVGPVTSVTCAPLRLQTCAMAYPILPVE